MKAAALVLALSGCVAKPASAPPEPSPAPAWGKEGWWCYEQSRGGCETSRDRCIELGAEMGVRDAECAIQQSAFCFFATRPDKGVIVDLCYPKLEQCATDRADIARKEGILATLSCSEVLR